MEDRVCLVTGATSGLGAATAHALAQRSAKLVVVGRDPRRCAATVARIRQQTGHAEVDWLLADLSVQAEVRRLADEFQRRYSRLDVLVNNAGGVFMRRQESVDGLELTFALNHLAYFLLTVLLLDVLKASAPARIVNVASIAHRKATIDFEDLQSRRRYRAFEAYARSKLANVLFTYELARRLCGEGGGITANAVDPGLVVTRLAQNNGLVGRLAMQVIHLRYRRIAVRAGEGARAIVYLATSPDVEGVSAKYFVNQQAVRSSAASYDLAAAQRLWEISERLTGLA